MFINDTDKLDQHFLIDKDVINAFIKSCDLDSTDKVLEIGPGNGVISRLVNPLVSSLTLVEKDTRLINQLKDIPNVNIINASILDIELPDCNKIITSLPYSITEPFMYKAIDYNVDRIVMICGKNFADNVINKHLNKLSVLTNSYFDVERILDIAPTSFKPSPRVYSSLLVLIPKDINTLNDNELIIRYLFKYRYMKLKNALKEIIIRIKKCTQKEAKSIVNNYNISSNILDKLFDELSNREMEEIYKKIIN